MATAERPRTRSVDSSSPSFQSLLGLNAANFFVAEISAVIMPFLSDFLQAKGWRYDAIGIATASAGLGVFLMQTPAGFLVDRMHRRRTMLASMSLLLGLCYGLLPIVPSHWYTIDSLLFISGAAGSFFVPLLSALALGLVGYAKLNKTIGANQSWNHAGNIAAALLAMALVGWFSTASIFYAVTVVSILAAASAFLIRTGEIDVARAAGMKSNEIDVARAAGMKTNEIDAARASGMKSDGASRSHGAGPSQPVGILTLFKDYRIVVLFAATALFHFANAPVMPLVAMYVKHLHGTDQQVAAVVLVAQLVMIPVALLTGWLCDRWGRKPIFAIGFIVLPLRIFLYSLATSPGTLVALQALDGIGAGIYGVAIVAICADLTKGKGRFNALSGLIATALAAGGVIGPLSSGLLVQHLGFVIAFNVFAAIAASAAVLFIVAMPETRQSAMRSHHTNAPPTTPAYYI